RMLGLGKSTAPTGNSKKLSALRDLPQLEMGRDYVLFTTRPSAIGLSTTVGLGQGAFAIQSGTKEESVANAFGNAGLDVRRAAAAAGQPRSGPIPYADLARAIREVTGGSR